VNIKELRSRAMELYEYDPKIGVFLWKVHRAWRHPGNRAGKLDRHGYVFLMLEGKLYPASWIAWLIVRGRFPKEQLDHKNLNPGDNRIRNLREATCGQNLRNRPKRSDSKSPYKGITKHQGKWRPRIRVDGKTRYFGLFDDPKKAFEAYKREARKHYGGFHNFTDRTR
jgi:hypothetical protein